MNNQNLGILIAPPRPSDYIFGSVSEVPSSRFIRDWSIYLPMVESQRNKVTDFADCSTMSAIHSIEMQLNYLMASNQLPDEALYFFHNNGYIVNGSFELSARFNASLNGTEKLKGNYLNVVGDCIRRDGLIPMLDWPVVEDETWTGFYSMIPVGLFSKAKKALWFLDIKYQWIKQENMRAALSISPLQVATEVCPGWDMDPIVQKCSGQPVQHATVIYGIDSVDHWLDFDHYPPYLQKLSFNYEFPYTMQYIITVKPLTLRNGMQGSNVLQLQKDLNALGFVVTEDSFFGPKTQIQVISFQNKTGLKPDGIAGPLTLAKLKDIKDMPSIKDIIKDTCIQMGIAPELGIAVAMCEGGITNAKITVQNTDIHHSIDRGIFQFNSYWESHVTDEQAFDPKLATIEFCKIVINGGLMTAWHLSEPCWSKKVSVEILQTYKIK